MSRARFLEEAEAEFLKEVQHYADVQAKGAERFRMAVEEAAVRALAFPMAGQPYHSNTRRVFVRGYLFFWCTDPKPKASQFWPWYMRLAVLAIGCPVYADLLPLPDVLPTNRLKSES